jgi:uncharacterized membrane protein (Fun14 family)
MQEPFMFVDGAYKSRRVLFLHPGAVVGLKAVWLTKVRAHLAAAVVGQKCARAAIERPIAGFAAGYAITSIGIDDRIVVVIVVIVIA